MSQFESVFANDSEMEICNVVSLMNSQSKQCFDLLLQERYTRQICGLLTPKTQISQYSSFRTLDDHEKIVFDENKNTINELIEDNRFGTKYTRRMHLLMRIMDTESGNFIGNVDFMREIISCIKLSSGIKTILEFRMCCLNLAISTNLMREVPAVKYQPSDSNIKAYANFGVMQGARITSFKEVTETAFELFMEFRSFAKVDERIDKRCLELEIE